MVGVKGGSGDDRGGSIGVEIIGEEGGDGEAGSMGEEGGDDGEGERGGTRRISSDSQENSGLFAVACSNSSLVTPSSKPAPL